MLILISLCLFVQRRITIRKKPDVQAPSRIRFFNPKWDRCAIEDLYQLSPSELQPFFEYKEKQYRLRQERITKFCQRTEPQYPVPLERNLFQFCHNYYFHNRAVGSSAGTPGFAYCAIAKVSVCGSGTKLPTPVQKVMSSNLFACLGRQPHVDVPHDEAVGRAEVLGEHQVGAIPVKKPSHSSLQGALRRSC